LDFFKQMRAEGRNANIVATFVFYFVASLSHGIAGSVSSNLLFLLTGANVYVGWAVGVQGILQMLVALPAGWWADRPNCSRARMLKYGAIIGWLECVVKLVTLVIVVTNDTNNDWAYYAALLVAHALYGIHFGCIDPPMDALFADSMRNGDERTQQESRRALLDNLGSASGPLTSLMLFGIIGNEWSRHAMSLVWLVGVLLSTVAVGCLFVYRDDAVVVVVTTEAVEVEKGENSSSSEPRLFQQIRRLTPYLCIVCDIVWALGTGMSTAFWSLFLANEVGMSPMAVSITLLLSSLVTVAIVQAAPVVAHYGGRVGLTMCLSSMGVATMLIIAVVHEPWLVSLLLIIRNAALYATTPLLRAVLMDSVGVGQRGKWASVSSVTTLGWSGSAVLGGWLCDVYGYGTTFYVTALVQSIALLPLVPLLLLERRCCVGRAAANQPYTKVEVSEPQSIP